MHSGLIPEPGPDLQCDLSFFLAGRKEEIPEGCICFYLPSSAVFSRAVFLFGRKVERKSGNGPDGILEIEFACP